MNEYLTRVSYIEAVLGIKYEGTGVVDLLNFIKANYRKARKAEPTFKDYMNSICRK